MTRYLLDTNIVSDLVRNPNGRIRARVASLGPGDEVFTNVIVAGEARYGGAKKNSARLMQQIETVLSALTVLPLEGPIDAIYGELRAKLERSGTPVGANDLLIASHVLLLDCTLVTDNVREFSQVDGLKIENWLR